LTGEGQGEGGFSPKNLFAEKSPSLCPSLRGREKKAVKTFGFPIKDFGNDRIIL